MTGPLILASASPRRQELLSALGLSFEVAVGHTDEPAPGPGDGAAPGAFVERVARHKALACTRPGLVLAADTVVALDGDLLGKPRDAAAARAMLARLSGRTHHVFTGVCLRLGERCESEYEMTAVRFAPLAPEFIARYVATGEPLDKAGAYAAQGKGALLIERIEGDYWNVVGLPLRRTAAMLARFGVAVDALWQAPPRPCAMSRLLFVAPVLPVREVRAALRFYGGLGFTTEFTDAPEPLYAGIGRDGVHLHLQWHEPATFREGVDAVTLRFRVDDPDALWREWEASGALPYPCEVHDTAWGTREGAFYDPDGNGLVWYAQLTPAGPDGGSAPC